LAWHAPEEQADEKKEGEEVKRGRVEREKPSGFPFPLFAF
jgi:hypothetical protein